MPECPPVLAPIIDVIGIGDEGAADLPPRLAERVAAATLLCGGARHLARFPDHPAERFVIADNLPALVARLARCTAAERPVVLASGDPCFYGIGPYLAARLGRERVRIAPAASSVALAFARLGASWHDAVVLSAHGRPLAPLVPRALAARKAVFLTDERNTPAVIARALLAAGHPDCVAHVFEHLGGPRERHIAGRLSMLAEQTFAPLNVLVILREPVAPHPHPLPHSWGAGETMPPAEAAPVGFGLPETVYAHRAGQITKAEVRAVSLGKLRLAPGLVLWDIGAGCGSLALEAARALYARVYAVERDAAQFALLQANAAAAPAPELALVHGEAPAALADLPDPDRVFLGGSGGQLAALLACIAARLRPGGRLVANFASLERLVAAHDWLRARGWGCELVQLAVARGAPLAGATRLVPLAPVFVLSADPPAREAVHAR
ncbi:MAG TPA: precorrin-6y C5,15-methyltransferase (decarboxylating) subunit CbiE [Chloroflexota bacterium]|nr:precorrin-6y C5,15-methyltransferase (decarboxylating) subunit CbiE [Chloroflexota bacterium]